jgi:hypothetical protein
MNVLYSCALPGDVIDGPKHVGDGALKHRCNSNQVCAFVG